jgi:hypothetical protein
MSITVYGNGVSDNNKDIQSGTYYLFYRATTCKDVQQVTPNEPVTESVSFLSTDSIALAWSHLVRLYKPVRMRTDWLDPYAQVYRSDTGSWTTDPETSGYAFWNWWKLWSWIYIKDFPPSDPVMFGTWTVKMYYEENFLGVWHLDTTMTFQITGGTDVHTPDMSPSSFALYQNYPNPFNPTTTIRYTLPVNSTVTLRIYDILGREVLRPVDGVIPAGYHEIAVNSGVLSSGIYFYEIEAGSFRYTRTMVVLK